MKTIILLFGLCLISHAHADWYTYKSEDGSAFLTQQKPEMCEGDLETKKPKCLTVDGKKYSLMKSRPSETALQEKKRHAAELRDPTPLNIPYRCVTFSNSEYRCSQH